MILKNNNKGMILTKFIILFVILIIIVISGFCIFKYYFYPLKHFDIVQREAKNNNIDPYLVLSIIKCESNFNKHATSAKNARGLMQIMDTTAQDVNNQTNLVEEINNSNIYDEEINIALGCKYFASLIKKYNGNYYLAICAYNAGMGNVDSWIEDGIIDENLDDHVNSNIPISETRNYLNRVINSYKIYKWLYK